MILNFQHVCTFISTKNTRLLNTYYIFTTGFIFMNVINPHFPEQQHFSMSLNFNSNNAVLLKMILGKINPEVA